jgi:hypothetical protein
MWHSELTPKSYELVFREVSILFKLVLLFSLFFLIFHLAPSPTSMESFFLGVKPWDRNSIAPQFFKSSNMKIYRGTMKEARCEERMLALETSCYLLLVVVRSNRDCSGMQHASSAGQGVEYLV